MEIENYFKIFNNYVKKFDFKNEEAIRRKFHHSYRVMEYAKEIAISLNLKEKDIFICQLIGLFHDFGRFKQWENYKTFKDHESIDHAIESVYEMEKENIYIDQDIKEIVFKAIKNHNKFKIEDNLSSKEKLFCNIIRDADKIDIMLEQGNKIIENDLKINDDIFKSIENKELSNNLVTDNEAEIICRLLCFIYDLNYDYSFKFILDKKIIENKVSLLINYVDDKRLENLENKLLDYVKERLEC